MARLQGQQPEQPEACCWRFEPVSVLGREGVIVLTAKRLLFAAPSRSANGSSNTSPGGTCGGDTTGSDGNSTWDVLLQFPLGAWTSTERSKKAAKARMSYVAPSAAAAPAGKGGGGSATGASEAAPAVQSVVVDFLGLRDTMDACCRSLQSLASAARTAQPSSNLLCPLDVPLLLHLLQLPQGTPLRVAPALVQQQELQRLQLQHQQQEEQQLKQKLGGSVQVTGSPAGITAVDKQQQQAGSSSPKLSRQKTTPVKPQSTAAEATAAAGAAASAVELPAFSLEKLQEQQRQQEAEQLQQLQQQLLQQNPELLALYQTLVGPTDGPRGDEAVSHKGLSAAEFWRLHQQQLQALKPQPAPEAVSAAFLSRPPRYHLDGIEPGKDAACSELMVDCSQQMLAQILKEDSTIKAAYAAFVDTGRMAPDRFWGRVFRSKYFQGGIGLADRQQEASDEDASEFIASFFKEAPLSQRDAMSLPGIERSLLSDADLRMRGFGLPDGLSSLAGDLAEKAYSAADANATSLVGRFNRHSQRLLLQQLLEPAAATAATSDKAGLRDQLHLLVELNQQQLKKQGAPAPAGLPAADLHEASTIGCGILAEETRLASSLRLEELEDTPPPTFQTLAVSRRQLYAAGARASTSPLTAAAPAVSPQAASSASSISAAAAAADAAAAQEAEAARAWLRLEQERESEENRSALQSAEEVAAVYETGRYMFVLNTKLCQKDKAAQVATLDYELSTVDAVRSQQSRVAELLRHFYRTTLAEEKKRTRLVQALDAIKSELENSQDFAGGFTGAATKALSAPLVEQITAAKRHAHRLQRLLQAAREKRATQHVRQTAQQHCHPAAS